MKKEQEEKNKAKFLEAIQAVEAEHRLKIIPMIEYHAQGLIPVLGLQKVDKVNINLETKKK